VHWLEFNLANSFGFRRLEPVGGVLAESWDRAPPSSGDTGIIHDQEIRTVRGGPCVGQGRSFPGSPCAWVPLGTIGEFRLRELQTFGKIGKGLKFAFDPPRQRADVDNAAKPGKFVDRAAPFPLRTFFDQSVPDGEKELIFGTFPIFEKPVYDLTPLIVVVCAVVSSEPHLADRAARLEHALPELPAVREAVKNETGGR
jgi:hypothetical protein